MGGIGSKFMNRVLKHFTRLLNVNFSTEERRHEQKNHN
jgi:hypothetical protein